ncbi:MAG: Nif3-like dinuclear metal center hexameric protein [Bacteroidota bacterium]|nr:Nif3-like dinuclear metal center hexameric protein [Bacteroidota bacterium]
MKLSEFQQVLDEWAPPAAAWKSDNVGLQVGSRSAEIVNILLALDVTMEVAREAVQRRANLIVTHHPLLFHPLRSLTPNSRAGEIALYLAEQKINLFAAHTNLDSVPGGVNFVLAELFGLKNISILSPLEGSMVKVVVFVPNEHLERVAAAMHGAGAGTFTKYEECSFRTEGVGTFRGTHAAHPFIGVKGILEIVPETKLEMIVPSWKLSGAIRAMLSAHPYEEAAYDIIPLKNRPADAGLGAIGNLPAAMSRETFLAMVKKKTGAEVLRYSGHSGRIQRVAVCGGAGSEFIGDAVQDGADAFVTADVQYHTFQDAEKDILLVDAGHFETESHVLAAIESRLKKFLKASKHPSKVYLTKRNTNPVSYYY